MTDAHLGLPSGGKVGGVPKWKIFSRGQQECPRFELREAWGSRFRGSAAGANLGQPPFENKMDKTARHKQCYDAAGWSNAPWLTLANCERKCLFSH